MTAVNSDPLSVTRLAPPGETSARIDAARRHGRLAAITRSKKLYWSITILFCLLIILSSIPDVLQLPQATQIIHDHLGYPTYFLPYIGIAKLLGALTILQPRFPRLKEWAFAGIAFDLLSAMYSAASVGDPPAQWAPISFGLLVLALIHTLHHRRLQDANHTD